MGFIAYFLACLGETQTQISHNLSSARHSLVIFYQQTPSVRKFDCPGYEVSNVFAGEVRRLYRAFKQDCPTGIVDEETFKEVYDKIFPLGDASHYAHLVFLSIDK